MDAGPGAETSCYPREAEEFCSGRKAPGLVFVRRRTPSPLFPVVRQLPAVGQRDVRLPVTRTLEGHRTLGMLVDAAAAGDRDRPVGDRGRAVGIRGGIERGRSREAAVLGKDGETRLARGAE